MEFRKVYLDGAASSPLDPEALKDMEEYMAGGYVGNSFSLYDDGIRSMQAVEKARGELAEALGVEPGQILFTSGATESNNWAIESTCMRALKNRSNKMMILSSPIEHSSVLNSARRMEVLGFRLKFTGLSPKGYIRSEDVSDADLDEAALVCVMAVNNETGMVNDVARIAKRCNAKGVPILVDCTQLVGGGKSLRSLGLEAEGATVDFASMSSHKVCGPTGVGCLVCADRSKLDPLIAGGAQEWGLRGGTQNTAGIVGFGSAAKRHISRATVERYESLCDFMEGRIRSGMVLGSGAVSLNAGWDRRDGHKAPNIFSVRVDGLPRGVSLSDQLIARGIECSAASACDSESTGVEDAKPSHVLRAMGIEDDDILHTARISFSPGTTEEDIKQLFLAVEDTIESFKEEHK